MKSMHYIFIRSSQTENVYGRFLGEILKAEGFNSFRIVDIDTEEIPKLNQDDLAVLTRCFLRQREIEKFAGAVEKGLNMLCVQPSLLLAGHFGLVPRNKIIYPGWIKIHEGLPGYGTPIQTHLPITAYDIEKDLEREILADGCDETWSKSDYPAALKLKRGKGSISFLFYDLPATVARIRFGNPELASYISSEIWNWQHAGDLFTGQIDERVENIPQADLHSQFLGKILSDMNQNPLPRIWYYEKIQHKTAAVFCSDDDMSKPEDFDALSKAVEKNNGGISFYLMKDTLLTGEHAERLEAEGYTFAPHINPGNCDDEWYFAFPEVIDNETELFKKKFGKPGVSLQCHLAPWQGYMEWLSHFIKNGYRILAAYVSLPVEMLNKYMCGSARPIKFTGLDGTVYDCWQQPIVTYDDLSIMKKMEGNYDSLIDDFKRLLNDCLTKNHTMISFSSHPKSYTAYSKPFFDPCLKMLAEEGVPVYNGDRWCEFQDRRYAVEINQEVVSENKISYTVKNLLGIMTLMFPIKNDKVKLKINGKDAKGETIKRLEENYLSIEIGSTSPASIELELEISR